MVSHAMDSTPSSSPGPRPGSPGRAPALAQTPARACPTKTIHHALL